MIDFDHFTLLLLSSIFLLGCAQPATKNVVPDFQFIPQKVNTNASFRGLAVRGSQIAWISGSKGTIFKTADGGDNWQQVNIQKTDSLDFRDIEIINDTTVLLMSVGPGPQSNIFKTTNGGESWRKVLTNTHESAFYNGINFWDNRSGMLISDPIDSKLLLLLTEDGGESWSRVGETSLPDLNETEYGFAASGTGIKCLGKELVWVCTGGDEARVFISPDKGKSWKVQNTGMASGNQSSGAFSIEMKDEQNGICVGGDYQDPEKDKGNVAITSDGGISWKLIKNDPPIFHKACVRHLGEHNYLAVGRTGIALTQDDGVTWAIISTDSFYTFDYDKDTGVGFLAGADGKISKIITK